MSAVLETVASPRSRVQGQADPRACGGDECCPAALVGETAGFIRIAMGRFPQRKLPRLSFRGPTVPPALTPRAPMRTDREARAAAPGRERGRERERAEPAARSPCRAGDSDALVGGHNAPRSANRDAETEALGKLSTTGPEWTDWHFNLLPGHPPSPVWLKHACPSKLPLQLALVLGVGTALSQVCLRTLSEAQKTQAGRA